MFTNKKTALFTYTATFTASMLLTLLITPVYTVYAATDLGYRFTSATATITNNTTNYGSNISNAVSAWNQYSDLNLSMGPSGNINWWEGNYGATGWDGGTVMYNSTNQACSNWPSLSISGNCNTTNKKATYGYIYFNTYYGSFYIPDYGTRHELGHAFGLGHVSCLVDSVMRGGACRPDVPTTLKSDELTQINAWY